MGNRFGGGDAPPTSPARQTGHPIDGEESRDGQKKSFFSKEVLEFLPGNDEEPVELILSNPKEGKLKFKFEPSPNPKCIITASPSSGAIAPGKEKRIKLRAENKEKENCKFKLTVYLGNEPHFLSVSVRTASGVFGVDPSTLDKVLDGDYKIPEVLYFLKKSLIDADGLQSEGLFRLAGEVADINETKNALNAKQFVKTNNVNTLATLIKVWFRELPSPILNELPTETIFYSNNIQACIDSFKKLSEPNKTLLSWLLDLLADTQEYKEINRMTCQNLAIVVAPNLYDSSSSDAMESLVLSQKCVEYLKNVLQWKVDQRNPNNQLQTPPKSSRRLSKGSTRSRVQSTSKNNSLRRSGKTESKKSDQRHLEVIPVSPKENGTPQGGSTTENGGTIDRPRHAPLPPPLIVNAPVYTPTEADVATVPAVGEDSLVESTTPLSTPHSSTSRGYEEYTSDNANTEEASADPYEAQSTGDYSQYEEQSQTGLESQSEGVENDETETYEGHDTTNSDFGNDVAENEAYSGINHTNAHEELEATGLY